MKTSEEIKDKIIELLDSGDECDYCERKDKIDLLYWVLGKEESP